MPRCSSQEATAPSHGLPLPSSRYKAAHSLRGPQGILTLATAFAVASAATLGVVCPLQSAPSCSTMLRLVSSCTAWTAWLLAVAMVVAEAANGQGRAQCSVQCQKDSTSRGEGTAACHSDTAWA